MCFITVTAATVLVNVVITVTNATVTIIVFFHGNVTTVITAVKLPREALQHTLHRKYCYQSLETIGILCGYYIRFELL